jgi:ribosomal protein L35
VARKKVKNPEIRKQQASTSHILTHLFTKEVRSPRGHHNCCQLSHCPNFLKYKLLQADDIQGKKYEKWEEKKENM